MSKPYTTAREKLAFIAFNSSRTYPNSSVPVVPSSQTKMLAETLVRLIELVDGMMKEHPKFTTLEGLEALRQIIEIRIMPLDYVRGTFGQSETPVIQNLLKKSAPSSKI